MAVKTSQHPSVPGPRTPFALYPEELERSPGHEGYKWRAGIRRRADGKSRYTSEYQRQYRPLPIPEAAPPPVEADREGVPRPVANPPSERKEIGPVVREREESGPSRPLVDLRRAYQEVEGDAPRRVYQEVEGDAPRRVYQEVEGNVPRRAYQGVERNVPRRVYQEVEGDVPKRVVEKFVSDSPSKQKRAAKRGNGKKGAKRAKQDPSNPPPLSEYQSQFQAWAPHSHEQEKTVSSAPKKLSADIRPRTPPTREARPSRFLARSPVRWSSEYRSNFSADSADVTEEPATSPWYQMLVELRERARVYRDRGRSSNLELPLSYRSSQVSDASCPPSDPPVLHTAPPVLHANPPVLPTESSAQERDSLNWTRDTATQVTSRSATQPTPLAPSSHPTSTSHVETSLSKLQLSTPAPSRHLDTSQEPHSSQLQRTISNTLRASVENHKSPSAPHEAVRARTAVPPIDITRIQSSPSPFPPGSPSYFPPPLPHTALSHSESSLQKQLFRYKQGFGADTDQVSVRSTTSLASHTLEKARRRQAFWK